MSEGVPVVWIGTVLGDATPQEFEDWFQNELGYKVKYETEFKMQDGYYKGLHCTLFNVLDNIGKFCIFRLHTDDMKWLDDFVDHHKLGIPMEILQKYADKEQVQQIIKEATI